MTVCSHHIERQRGGTIVAVLMLLVIGIIIVASVLVTADAARATSHAEAQRTQARSLGWSGVQALMAELARQREDLLDGQAPNITAEWDLYTLDDGTRGVVRLIDLEPEGVGIIASENAKLDINTATAEMLALVPGLDRVVAEKIIEARQRDPFTSVEQLLEIEGVSPELLYGVASDSMPKPPRDAEVSGLLGEAADSRGLLPFLTVFSFDPNVQVGLDGNTDSRGNLRVNLDQEWSDELERAITDRFDQATADFVRGIMETGQSFATDSELVGLLVTNNMPTEQWAMVLDVFTTTDDQFLRGRVDVNVALPEVLACLPGISPEKAEAIVAAREGLDASMRRSPTWLVVEGVLTPEEFAEAADWVTTRSMQWRARLEVGLEAGDPFGGFEGSVPMSLDDLAGSWDEPEGGSRLASRIVLETVIDLGSTRPRVAYLREVTLFEPIFAMHLATAEAEAEERLFDPFEGLPDLEAMDGQFASELSDEDTFLSEFGDRDSGFGEPLGESLDDRLDDEETLDGARDESGELEPDGQQGEAPGEPTDMIDRRIGRWSTRKAGES